MRWRTKIPVVPKLGDIRRRTVFAFFPHKCDDGFTRWLEWVVKVEKVEEVYAGDVMCGYTCEAWRFSHWAPVGNQFED